MERQRIVACVGRKGGSGKTTTTLNLAGLLGSDGLAVLVVDTDPQASLTRLVFPDRRLPGLGECLRAAPNRAAERIVATGIGFDLLPGDRTIEIAGLELYDSPAGFVRLRQILLALGGYDLIVIDSPPSLGFALSSALLAAGWAILPTELAQQDFDALADTIQVMNDLAEADMPVARRLAIVPNNVRHDQPDQTGLATLRAQFGELVSQPVPMAAAIKRSLNDRLPLVLADPRAPALAAYRDLAARVVGVVEPAHAGR